MKLKKVDELNEKIEVAPCVGAWIETEKTRLDKEKNRVAPCVGAWIETVSEALNCGRSRVAPCVGAWIETHWASCSLRPDRSHPAWVRGLKQHPDMLFRRVRDVAPCVGAWIETTPRKLNPHIANVAPCVGAWIETGQYTRCQNAAAVAPCVGAWIETRPDGVFAPSEKSHPAWVRGLKQTGKRSLESLVEVAPCVGAWIETYHGHRRQRQQRVAPCVGAWIETKIRFSDITPEWGRTLRGCVD